MKTGFELFRSCPYLPHDGPTSNRIGSFIERWNRVSRVIRGFQEFIYYLHYIFIIFRGFRNFFCQHFRPITYCQFTALESMRSYSQEKFVEELELSHNPIKMFQRAIEREACEGEGEVAVFSAKRWDRRSS